MRYRSISACALAALFAVGASAALADLAPADFTALAEGQGTASVVFAFVAKAEAERAFPAAIAALERFLRLSPDGAEAAEARAALQRLLAAAGAWELAEAMGEGAPAAPGAQLSGAVSAGLFVDGNANGAPRASRLFFLGGALEVDRAEAPEAGAGAVLEVEAQAVAPVGARPFVADLSAMAETQFDTRGEDVAAARLQLGPVFEAGALSLRPLAYAAGAGLDGDFYGVEAGLGADAAFALDAGVRGFAALRFGYADFSDISADPRGSDLSGLRASARLALSRAPLDGRFGLFGAGLYAARVDADAAFEANSDGGFFAFWRGEAALYGAAPVELFLNASYGFAVYDAADPVVNAGALRADRLLALSAGLAAPLGGDVFLLLDARYIERASNYDVHRFDSARARALISVRF